MATAINRSQGANVGRLPLSLTVVGGVGSVSFKATGRIELVIIKSPAGSDYIWTIEDDDNCTICAATVVGATEMTAAEDRIPCQGTNTLSITAASHDGAYTACIYGEGYSGDWSYS